jgi:Chromo (CHRromatin Organisation MOdifier) domain
MSRLHPVFNVVKLLLAPEDPILGRRPRPPPPLEIVDREEHYIVEQILGSRFVRGQLQFLVKWEGYGYEENTWVPEQDVSAPDKLREFYRTHPGAPNASVQLHSNHSCLVLRGRSTLDGG